MHHTERREPLPTTSAQKIRQAEDALRSRERQIQALISSLDDIVFEVDTHGTYVNIWTANDALLFRPREEVIGKRFDEVFGEEASRPFFEYLARTLASDTPHTLEYSLDLAGIEHWFAARYNPIHDRQLVRTTVSILVRDITERKRAEALVYAQRDMARCIGTASTVEGGFRAILEIMLHLTGMDSGGIYLFSPDARSLDLVYHQGLGPEFIAAVGSYLIDSPNVQVILTGKAFYFPYGHPVTQTPTYLAEQLRSAATLPILYQDRVIGCFNLASHTADDVRHFARQALEPLAVEAGNFVVYLQSQAALRASEEKFRQLADTINEVFWIFDNRQQRLVYLNPAYEKVWGTSIEDTYRDNRKYIETIHSDDRPILFAALARQAQGEQTEMEYRIVRPDGAVRWIFDRSFPILGADGRVQRTAGLATDITALKHTQQELQELNRSLEARVARRNAELARALRIKDEFLANMSHELRTPLHGILAMTETLLDQIRGPLNERQQKSVALIDESGRHLLALINDLLDLSKIEAGRLELHFAPVSIDEVCRISLLFVREMAVKKEIGVDYTSGTPGARFVADEQRVKQMLVNLLGNAVKFTPSGGHVRLGVTLELGAGLIHFAVQDTGPGIAPADQPGLFQPFVQVDTQLSRQHAGTGLGLALVKRLAEQHGGTVRLDSTGIPGQGACFIITLPLAPPLPPGAPAA